MSKTEYLLQMMLLKKELLYYNNLPSGKRTVRAREQRVGQILIHFLIHHTFLVISEKVVQTFLLTVSQSVKDGREYRGDSSFTSIFLL